MFECYKNICQKCHCCLNTKNCCLNNSSKQPLNHPKKKKKSMIIVGEQFGSQILIVASLGPKSPTQ